MSDLLQEFTDSRGISLRVDRTLGVIRGIKILGLRSRNGREYSADALARALGLYEGAKVNVNHPKGHPLTPRDYQERIGVIRNVQHRTGEGLFGDFHFNPKHPLAEQLAWDAEHAPENVGFSHNVQARLRREDDTTHVEEIVRVHSVDLVADPATTRGLFESASAAIQSDELPPAIASFSATPSPSFASSPSHGESSDAGDDLQESAAGQTASRRSEAAELADLRAELAELKMSLVEAKQFPRPTSRDQHAVQPHPCDDARSFATAITR
ncbi:MAG: hypothetical protein IT427_13095 [Pirellulales bacterium]|nr:hypothetical protein [Pirellulales bacterium]